MEFTTTITTRLQGLRRFRSAINNARGNQHIRAAMNQWAFRYRAFLQERFDRLSKGGGEWPPLTSREGTILRDTGTLFAALSPSFTGAPGQFQNIGDFEISVGFGGGATHPSGDATVAQIAAWHDAGAGNYPQREIIVLPTRNIVRGFEDDLDRALQRIADESTLDT